MNVTDLVEFEKEVAELFKQKKIKCPIHLSSGNESQLINIFDNILSRDYVFSTHRNHLHYLLHTGDKEGLMKRILDGDSMHTCNPDKHFYSSSIVAGCVAIACGVALALKMKGSPQKVYCFIGDGATDEGWVTEAIKYAGGQDLPLMFILENNDRSVVANIQQRWGSRVFNLQSKLMEYEYTCNYPHAGYGEWVTF